MHPTSRDRTTRLGSVAALALLVAATLGACSDDDSATPSTTTAPAEATTSTTPGEPPGGEEDYTPGDFVQTTAYADGRHAAFIRFVDGEARTVDVDLAEFLTGDAAVSAHEEDTGSAGGLDTDYYVRNRSKAVRRWALADDLRLRVNSLAGVDPSQEPYRDVDFVTFVGYFYNEETSDQAEETLFWISVKGGVVIGAEEQYLA